MNLVAELIRGMRVEDAILQLQVTVKRAAKTVYQVHHIIIFLLLLRLTISSLSRFFTQREPMPPIIMDWTQSGSSSVRV